MSRYPVNQDELWDGRVFKNYRVLCHQMGWKPGRPGNNTYNAQVKSLSSVCRWRKDVDVNGKKLSNKIIIEEVYSKPLPIEDGRKNVGFKVESDNYRVPIEHVKSNGIYRIICGNEVYIGSTRRGFRRRFIEHLNAGQQPATKDLLDRGGLFELVEVMNDSSKEEVFMREDYYIELYSKDSSYVVVNKQLATITLPKPPKPKYKKVMIVKEDYDLALSILKAHGIKLKPDAIKEDEQNVKT